MSKPDHQRGFHGPKCWLLSAAIGAILGLVLWQILPARYPASKSHTPDPHAADILIVETRPDGTQHLRLPDESTSPLLLPFKPGDPISLKSLSDDAERAIEQGHSSSSGTHAGEPIIPIVLCIPFALLLLSIAVMPFINERFWHAHFPDFSFLLGSLILSYYLAAFGGFGSHEVLHAAHEYYSFIALVGGLYVVSGGILIDIRSRGRPLSNTLLLGLGAVLANIVGTTGASVLLIRPFMRMNRDRLRPLHAVFFIFIVSNCAGSLTPIGDPPLYLGYLKGVPFVWTLTHLWPMWLLVNGTLLGLFFAYDSLVKPPIDDPSLDPLRIPEEPVEDPDTETRAIIAGLPAVALLGLLVACVFVDPLIGQYAPGSGAAKLPIGATLQIILAAASLLISRPSIRRANQFTFAPVKEVGFLFVGIFLTMTPALGCLRANAMSFGLESPTQFYFGTGMLSGVLDNAPTYLSFMQVAFGVLHLPLDGPGIAQFIANTFDIIHGDSGRFVHFNGQILLEAISLGAVFFGALTYIGNGPNFMVKSIVDAAHKQQDGLGVKMPSFFAYVLFAATILLPVLILNWLIFVR